MDNGWIKLHRDMVNWEWYSNPVTKVVFLDLLIHANHEPKKWRGTVVERGQHVASYGILAQRLGLSVKMVRTAIKHLKRTHEVAHKGHSKYGLFTINNYDKYQDMGTQVGTQRATNKNDKNIKNIYILTDVDKIQFNSFNEYCEKWGIENLIKIKAYCILKSEFTSKVNWWEQVQKCVTWLVSNQKKKINLLRLKNWMSNSIKFQKDYETKMKQQYQDKKNPLAPPPAKPKQVPLWKPPA